MHYIMHTCIYLYCADLGVCCCSVDVDLLDLIFRCLNGLRSISSHRAAECRLRRFISTHLQILDLHMCHLRVIGSPSDENPHWF